MLVPRRCRRRRARRRGRQLQRPGQQRGRRRWPMQVHGTVLAVLPVLVLLVQLLRRLGRRLCWQRGSWERGRRRRRQHRRTRRQRLRPYHTAGHGWTHDLAGKLVLGVGRGLLGKASRRRRRRRHCRTHHPTGGYLLVSLGVLLLLVGCSRTPDSLLSETKGRCRSLHMQGGVWERGRPQRMCIEHGMCRGVPSRVQTASGGLWSETDWRRRSHLVLRRSRRHLQHGPKPRMHGLLRLHGETALAASSRLHVLALLSAPS